MAKAINKVVESGGGGGFDGFFDAFTKGFTRGMTHTKEFMALLREIRKALKVVNIAGAKLGKMFIEEFPGVSDMLKGLKELFNAKDIKKMMDDVIAAFRKFFDDLKDPKKRDKAVQGLFDGLTKAFGDFGDKKGKAFAMIQLVLQ